MKKTYILHSTFRGGVPPLELVEDDILPVLSLGQIFCSREQFKEFLQKYAIRERFETKPVKSRANKVVVKCRGEGCNWRCSGCRVKGTDKFKITNIVEPHTCKPLAHREHMQCKKRLIVCKYVLIFLKFQPKVTMKFIRSVRCSAVTVGVLMLYLGIFIA